MKLPPTRVDESQIDVVLDYIGANVRRLRLARGWTQDQLAEAAGLHLTYVQRVELGKTNLGVTVLMRLALALGVSPGALFKPATLPEMKRGRPRVKKPAE